MSPNAPDDHHSITRWIHGLKAGDPRSAELIWRQYFEKLVRLAGRRLGGLPRRAADEEDLALSALNSVIHGARQERFPRLADRTDLWKLLIVVTTRKVTALQRRHFAAKRPDARVVADEPDWVADALGREPSPDFAAQFAEEVRHLLAGLPGDDFRQVALLRMEGYTNREIAARLDWYEVKVERRLRIIRKQWAAALEIAHDG